MAVTRRPTVDSLKGRRLARNHQVFYAGNGFASVRSRRGVPGAYLGADMTAAAGFIDRTANDQQDSS